MYFGQRLLVLALTKRQVGSGNKIDDGLVATAVVFCVGSLLTRVDYILRILGNANGAAHHLDITADITYLT